MQHKSIIRLLLLIGLLLCIHVPSAKAAPALVQSCNNIGGAGATTLTCTFGGAITGSPSELLYFCVHQVTATPVAITWSGDSGIFIPEAAFAYSYSGGPVTVQCFFVHGTGGGGTIITATFASGANFPLVTGDEYSGVGGGLDVHDTLGATGTGTTATSSSVTTTANGDLVIGFIASVGATITAGSGYTLAASFSGAQQAHEYQVQGSKGSINATATLNSSLPWEAHIVTFFANAQPLSIYPSLPIVQVAQGGAGSCTFAQPVTSGNRVVAYSVWITGTATPSVTDTLSTSFSQKLLDTSSTIKSSVYAGTAGSSGANTVTFSEASAAFQNTHCLELNGTLISLTTDGAGTTFGASSPPFLTTPSVTTTMNKDFILFGAGGFNNGCTPVLVQPAMNLSSTATADCGLTGFYIAPTPSTYNGTWNNPQPTTSMSVAIVAFQPTSGITINSPAALPDGVLSNAYDYTLQASGGIAAYTWSITSGTLQTGLSLDSSTGRISGTPTVGPQNTITFHVTDGTNTANLTATLKVSSAQNTIAFIQGVYGDANPKSLGTVTSGHLIVIGEPGVGSSTFAGPTYCTDTLGTVFKLITVGGPTVRSNSLQAVDSIWAGVAQSTGADSITCGTIQFSAAEFSNAASFGGDNTQNTSYQGTSPITSAAITTLVPNQLLFAQADSSATFGNFTPVAPFTVIGTGTHAPTSAYDLASTVTTYTPSFTFSGSCAGAATACAILTSGLRATGGGAAPGPVSGHHQLIEN